MIGNRARRSGSGTASWILHRIFGPLGSGFAFRLWDGTNVVLGAAPSRFVVVVHTAQAFARLIREPTPLRFAEAFVEGAIDIEGDLFAAMEVANAIEDLKVPLGLRLRVLVSLWAA